MCYQPLKSRSVVGADIVPLYAYALACYSSISVTLQHFLYKFFFAVGLKKVSRFNLYSKHIWNFFYSSHTKVVFIALDI